MCLQRLVSDAYSTGMVDLFQGISASELWHIGSRWSS